LAFTHITFQVRGDGRTYAVLIRTPGQYDLTSLNAYVFYLHTRGGPYWQTVKIPFSKFAHTSHGRFHDQYGSINLAMVNSICLSLIDNRSGPFQLEIKNIGLKYEKNHREQSAYELYYHPSHGYAG
jgi:NADH dehydrogenase [ubiquinone] 1 alpha subcomplex assembly factor 1